MHTHTIIASAMLAMSTAASAQQQATTPHTQTATKATYTNPVTRTSLPDPTVERADDGYFYLYATENIRNLPICRSRDLVDWTFVGTAFTDETRPQWNAKGNLWAPDINRIGGKYVL